MTNKRMIYIFLSGIFAWSLSIRLLVNLAPMSQAIVAGTAQAPFQYRALWPHFYVRLQGLLHSPAVIGWVLWFLLFASVALVIDEYLSFWFEETAVWGWVVVMLAVFVGTHHFELGYDIWSLAEVLFIAVALLLIQRGREWWLVPVILLATLNRETGGIIAIVALVATRRLGLSALLVMLWAITYGSIRLYYGSTERVVTIGRLFVENAAAQNVLLFLAGSFFFGWFFWLAWKGRASAPPMARRVAITVLVYLPFVFVWGRWGEWRLYMPFYPLLLPLVLSAVGENKTLESE